MNTVNDMGTPLFCTEDRQCMGNRNSLKKSLVFVGIIYLVCAAVIALSAIKSGNDPISGVIILTAFTGIMTADMIFKAKQSTDRNYNVFYFYDSCYINIDRLSRTAVPYDLIIKAAETKDAFVIYIEPMRKQFKNKKVQTHMKGNDSMNIIVDAFGGDNAPLAVIEGAARAVAELGVEVTLTGNEKIIRETAEKNNLSLDKISIIHTESVIDIHEEPTEIIKSRKDCSMAVGLQALADGKGDAFVSAGSTGALVVGSTFIAKRLKGIKRPALAPILPTANGHLILMDGGANVDCRPEMLMQFGIMGSCYMEKVMGVKSPKVGLLNVGAEDTKGRELDKEAYKLLKDAPVNFYGNLEAREMPKGVCQVAVSDGFTGNIALKLYEGMGSFFAGELKGMLTDGLSGKLAALLIMKKVKAFKKKLDYTEVGGGVLMGVSKPVIKAHGSSNGKAFYNAIRQAKKCVDGKVIEEISRSLEAVKKQDAEA